MRIYNYGYLLEEGTIATYPDQEFSSAARMPRRIPGSGIVRQPAQPSRLIDQPVKVLKEAVAQVEPQAKKAVRDFSKPSFTPEVPKQWRHLSIIALAALVATIGFDSNLSTPKTSVGQADAAVTTSAPKAQARTLTQNDVSLPAINSINLPPVPVKNSNAKEPLISAANVYMMDDTTKMPLYAKGADDQIAVASTTKIMTAQLVLENYPDLNKTITISPEAINEIGSAVGFHPGETATIHQLLYGLLMVSGNDAARSLSEQLLPQGGAESTSVWVEKMNDLAARLGMTNSHFADPAGLDDVNGHSTAADMAKAMSSLMKKSVLAQIVGTANYEYTSPEGYRHTFKNSNRLITDEMPYMGMEGGKTGFTPKTPDGGAGHCMIVSATRDGHRVIAAVYGTYSNAASASAEVVRDVLNYGFNNYTWQTVSR